ncbi:MAG: glycosyltransferase family 2 protein [Bacillales bacterium]|nr:glycosyltransferase family 2 protein [Bacillales bacterium]
MNNDLVSIIIPTYKRSDNLIIAIDSVLLQSYKNIEVIVVDDNDPNTEYRKITEKKMLKYKKDSRVKYIKHKLNKNGAAARNTGIRNSKGLYIGFLDDDDYFERNKITEQYTFLKKNPSIKCVSCSIYRNNRIVKQNFNNNTCIYDIMMMNFNPITSTLLFERNALLELSGFNESYKRHQDLEIMLRYLKKYELGYIDKPLITMGINNGENMLNGVAFEALKKQFLNEFISYVSQIDIPNAKANIICKNYSLVCINYLKNHKWGNFFSCFIKNTIIYPVTFNKYFFKLSIAKCKEKIRRKHEKKF